MTYLEDFVAEIEAKEAAEDLYFSIYYMPECYQNTEEVDGW